MCDDCDVFFEVSNLLDVVCLASSPDLVRAL
jgi:hypothetical protein